MPVREADEEFIANWEKVQYQGKTFDDMAPELFTAKGERVRSKSELIIADILNQGLWEFSLPIESIMELGT